MLRTYCLTSGSVRVRSRGSWIRLFIFRRLWLRRVHFIYSWCGSLKEMIAFSIYLWFCTYSRCFRCRCWHISGIIYGCIGWSWIARDCSEGFARKSYSSSFSWQGSTLFLWFLRDFLQRLMHFWRIEILFCWLHIFFDCRLSRNILAQETSDVADLSPYTWPEQSKSSLHLLSASF